MSEKSAYSRFTKEVMLLLFKRNRLARRECRQFLNDLAFEGVEGQFYEQ